MRRSFRSALMYEESKFVGINLGFDYCAEHEWGIKGIQEAFGLQTDLIGFQRYQNTLVPGGEKPTFGKPQVLTITKFTDRKMPWVGLYFNAEHFYGSEIPIKKLLPLPYKHIEDEICAAWDEHSFGIVVHKESAWVLDEIMNAINNKDILIRVGPMGPFKDGGLKLMIASQISQKAKDIILSEHVDYAKLMKAVKKTKIEDYLAKHGKRYYALAPQWYSPTFKPNNRDLKTKYKVVFFLNPCEQSKYKAGWYTVEELKEWANDKGIVLK